MGSFVYFIVAHHLPGQLERLVLTLLSSSPAARVVLHLDPSTPKIDAAPFEAMQRVHVLPDPVAVRWGDFSLSAVVVAGLQWINANMDAGWVFLLSGQDYPITNLVQMERFYARTDYDAFVSAVPLDSSRACDPVACGKKSNQSKACTCPDCTSRYYYRYYEITWLKRLAGKSRITRLPLQWLLRRYSGGNSGIRLRNYPHHKGGNIFLGMRSEKIFNTKRCYKGFSWFSLNGKCLKATLRFLKQEPAFTKHYSRTIIPDESFFPTLLFNLKGIKVCQENYRFILWKDHRSANPEILKNEHYDLIVNSGKHFARKFDYRQDLNILRRLDCLSACHG